jgi:hypothetical protein
MLGPALPFGVVAVCAIKYLMTDVRDFDMLCPLFGMFCEETHERYILRQGLGWKEGRSGALRSLNG